MSDRSDDVSTTEPPLLRRRAWEVVLLLCVIAGGFALIEPMGRLMSWSSDDVAGRFVIAAYRGPTSDLPPDPQHVDPPAAAPAAVAPHADSLCWVEGVIVNGLEATAKDVFLTAPFVRSPEIVRGTTTYRCRQEGNQLLIGDLAPGETVIVRWWAQLPFHEATPLDILLHADGVDPTLSVSVQRDFATTRSEFAQIWLGTCLYFATVFAALAAISLVIRRIRLPARSQESPDEEPPPASS